MVLCTESTVSEAFGYVFNSSHLEFPAENGTDPESFC
jgi:hypothetical protein